MKKKLLFVLLTLLISSSCIYAQSGIGVSAFYSKPAGDFGNYFENKPGIEISYEKGGIMDRFSFFVSIGFQNMTARQDTFFTYEVVNGHIEQDQVEIDINHMISFDAGFGYRILENNFSPILGVAFSLNSLDCKVSRKTINTEGGEAGFGIYPYLAASYKLKYNMNLSVGMGRTFMINPASESYFKNLSIWKPFIKFIYYWGD